MGGREGADDQPVILGMVKHCVITTMLSLAGKWLMIL